MFVDSTWQSPFVAMLSLIHISDRLLKVEHTLGGAKVTLAAYAYDNLGRLDVYKRQM